MGTLHSNANSPVNTSEQTDNDKAVIAAFLAKRHVEQQAHQNQPTAEQRGLLTDTQPNTDTEVSILETVEQTDVSNAPNNQEAFNEAMNQSDALDETTTKKGRKAKPAPEPKAKPATDLNLQAVCGVMGNLPYYITTMTLGDVANRMDYSENAFGKGSLSADEEYQRKINKNRVKASMVPYLAAPEHFFPPLVAYLSAGEYVFTPTDGSATTGTLTLSADAFLHIGDGQHRKCAIDMAIEADPDNSALQSETVGVVFIPGLNTDQKQQLFSDLNRNAKLPSKAIGILYDHREVTSAVAQAVANFGVLAGKVKLDTSTLSKNSQEILTLSALYEMVKSLTLVNPDSKSASAFILKDRFDSQSPEDIADYVSNVISNTILKSLPASDLVVRGVKDAPALNRTAYICYSGLGWQSIARAVAEAQQWPNMTLELIASGLKSIDWSMQAPVWKSCVSDGKVVSNKTTISIATRLITDLMTRHMDK